MFSYIYSAFPLQTIYQYFSFFISISLPSPQQTLHVPHHRGLWVQGFPTEVLQLLAGREAPPWPAVIPMMSCRQTPVLGVDTRSGLLWFCSQLCWVALAPPNHRDPAVRSSCSREGSVSPEPKSQSPRFYSFTSAFLQVLILWERRQNLSFLPRSTLPAPLTETTVPVQQVINHTLNSTHKSRHPAVTKFLLQWGRSTRWFVI